MQVIPSFDPTQSTNGQIQVGAVDPNSKLLLYNLSPVNIQIFFENGSTALLHSGEANYWPLDGDTPTIEWEQYSVLNVTNPPISEITGQVFGPNEKITGTYPASLTYQVTVTNPNGINTNVNSTSAIVNDGNPAGTSIIESTVSGQTQSSISLTNDGLLGLSVLVGGVLAQILKTATTDPLISIGASGHVAAVLGNLQVNTIQDSAGNSWAAVTPGTTTRIQTGSGGTIAFQVPGGNTIASVQSSGVLSNTYNDNSGNSVLAITPGSVTRLQTGSGGTVALQVPGGNTIASAQSDGFHSAQYKLDGSAGNYGLYTNSLSRIQTCTGTGSISTNHNLGATPSYATAICAAAGSSQTMGITFNATQVTVVAGSGFSWNCLTLRY